MNGTNRNLSRVLAAVALLAIAVALSGCGKEEPAAQRPTPAPTGELTAAAQEAAATVKEKAEEAILQTTCPIMGGAINKAIFVEYQGKKVYFCCKGCETEFNKEPEKYVAKLPQFQQ
ncbi:MAG: YHS domain-containing protein [Sedimentisphaerales bacterium]|nr:YHS domain-containing protein [Sedimentisphaerales bacterium]